VKFYLSKSLQMAGMVVVGVGLFRGVAEVSGLRFELEMLVAGSLVFLAGRLVEGRGDA
jgi:hypothetical protein